MRTAGTWAPGERRGSEGSEGSEGSAGVWGDNFWVWGCLRVRNIHKILMWDFRKLYVYWFGCG